MNPPAPAITIRSFLAVAGELCRAFVSCMIGSFNFLQDRTCQNLSFRQRLCIL